VETNDALWNTYHGGSIAFAINEQFDKILLSKLLPADTEAEVGVYPLVISWVCSWFCIEQRIL
jgi:hypothetical protein